MKNDIKELFDYHIYGTQLLGVIVLYKLVIDHFKYPCEKF